MFNAQDAKNKYSLNDNQANIMTAMVLAGSPIADALKAIAGYKSDKPKVNSLTCPRCTGLMSVVGLFGGRRARYCPRDRVTLPLKHASE